MQTEPDTSSLLYGNAEQEEDYMYHSHNGDDADGGSLATAQMLNDPRHNNPSHNPQEEYDATSVVHEMHLALLYLLSNPDEFQRALAARPNRNATTLNEWNAEYEDTESLADTTATSPADHPTSLGASAAAAAAAAAPKTTPLPFVVFADDAEVVLPAAFSASQLFGLEKVTGMELEAAAGLPALSQLFLRWLALMPGGDHLNLIDPPGLTVMRIAGGRYRVTAAHRVVWTWMNDFPNLETADSNFGSSYLLDPHEDDNESLPPRSGAGTGTKKKSNFENQDSQLHPGDLVTLTIVDVFETDNQGKLLSYCPTFDNRAVVKTNAPTETLRKSTAHLTKLIGKAQKSYLARKIAFHATQIAMSLKERVEEAVANHIKASPKGLPASYKANILAGSPTRSNNMDATAEEKKDSLSSSGSFSSRPRPGSSITKKQASYDQDGPHEV